MRAGVEDREIEKADFPLKALRHWIDNVQYNGNDCAGQSTCFQGERHEILLGSTAHRYFPASGRQS